MYVPRHFAAPGPEAVATLLSSAGISDLVTCGDSGLVCTALPFLFEPQLGPAGTLQGHVARANPQWRTEPATEALVIVRGPNAYISPSWYASHAGDGRVVPTWNYIVAHVYGRLVVHDDPVWTEALVRRLTARYEAGMEAPWSPDDTSEGFLASQLKAVVGVEVEISRIEGKWKLGQNRAEPDVAGAVRGLERTGGELARAVAAAMTEALAARRPQAPKSAASLAPQPAPTEPST